MESLPTITSSKHSLVEASKEMTKSAQSFAGGDSGLDLRGTCSNPASRTGSARSPPSGFLRSSHTTPLSPRLRTPSKGTAEYVRISKGEHERKEQLLGTLRSECQQLQAKVRSLENHKESHAMLYAACTKVIAMLGCPTEGVTVESLKEILSTRVSGLSQELHHTEQQLLTCRSQLEATRTELAAANVRVTSLESQCQQTKAIQLENERQLQHLTCELEKVRESNARTTASLESVRENMKGMEERRCHPDVSGITELQLELGRLKSDLRTKEEVIQDLEQRVQERESEQAITCDRASSAEGMYAELCVQMAAALDLDASDSYDTGYLVSRVNSVLQENDELKAKTNTLSMSVRSVELDSTASKETISYLESELKRAEQEAERLRALQETSQRAQSSLKNTIEVLGREKESLNERLAIAKETIVAQQQEIKLKEAKISELSTQVHTLNMQYDTASENVVCLQSKLEEFMEGIGSLLGTSSYDAKELLHCMRVALEKLLCKEKEMSALEHEHKQLQSKHTEACGRLAELHKELEQEGNRLARVEGEVAALQVVNKGLRQDVERHKPFVSKLARALQLDSGAAEILSGEFAEEAILSKINQLANHETQALVEKQCSVYTLQRKLKVCKQALDSKELHNGLLQKKIISLEGRLLTAQQNEAEWGNAVEKAAKTDKQLERLQGKLAQQAEAISQLKTHKAELEKLRMICDEQKQVIIQLKESVDDLNHTKVRQAQQLAEVRQKTETTVVREQGRVEGLGEELRALNKEIGQLRDKEKELSVFRGTVRRLLALGGGENQSDYDVIAKLEGLVAKYKKQVETSRQLEDSLKQLESGFRSGYNNTMTVLSSDT